MRIQPRPEPQPRVEGEVREILDSRDQNLSVSLREAILHLARQIDALEARQ